MTVPVEIRREWDLKPGDRVVFERDGGKIVIRPATSRLTAGYGAAKPRRRPEGFAAIREVAEQAVAREAVGEE